MIPSLLFSVALAADPIPECDLATMGDTVQLVTISSAPTLDRAFGHTAILFYEPSRGETSAVYDFGNFDSTDPVAVVRDVLLGTQSYYLKGQRLDHVRKRYGDFHGREMILQELRVSRLQRDLLADRLNHLLQNDRYFDYNWYEPNCTTRARDQLDETFDFQLALQHSESSGTSPARQVLRHSMHVWPMWFGLHWGSGRVADQDISHWDSTFLPETLMERMRHSTVPTAEGPQPLVVRECRLSPNQHAPIPADPPNRDGWMALLGLAASVGVLRVARGRRAAWVAGATGLLYGVFGSLALMVGLLGSFAPFWGHHNLYFANPGHLALVVAAVISVRTPQSRRPEQIASALLAVAGIGVLAALFHGLDDRNLGVWALCLPPVAAVWWALRSHREQAG